MKKFLLFAAAALVATSASAEVKNVLASYYDGNGKTFGGWGGSATFENVDEDGKPCLKITNPAEAENDWNVQAAIDFDFVPGTTYYMDLEVKGTVAGSITSGLQNSTSYAGGGNFTPFEVSTSWNVQTISCTATEAGDGLPNRWVANFGKYVGECYITNLVLYTLEEGGETPVEGGWTSIIEGGNANDGESPSLQANWSGNAPVVDNPAGEGKVYECPIAADPANAWDSQFFIKFNEALPAGTKLKVSFDYYCSDARSIDVQAQGEAGNYHHWTVFGHGLDAKPEWQALNWEGEVSAEMAKEEGFKTIALNLASQPAAATFYINNVVVEKESETGVEAVNATIVVVKGVYNLQGVKVADSISEVNAPGLYISNGKKVIVK